MAAWVLRGPSWRSLYSAPTALVTLTTSLRPTLAATKPYFSLSPETPTMQAIREMKYPETPVDPSIFEETKDYSSHESGGQPAFEHQSNATGDLPALLVTEGKYEEATRILDELYQMHVPPRASRVFVDTALHLYRATKSAGVQEQCATFRRWYSLIPDAFSARRLSDLDSRKILDMLLGSPIVDLPLIGWYLRINISKGYFLCEYAAIIRDFIRISNSHATVRLLDAIWHRSSRALDRVTCLYSKRGFASKQGTRAVARAEYKRSQMIRACYNVALDQLCRSNRTRAAVLVLQTARQRSIRVSTSVLSQLVPMLESISDWDSLSYVKQLLGTRQRHEVARPLAQAPSLDYHNLHEPSQLAAAIRIIRRHVHTPTCPAPSDLVHVIDACMRAGRLSLLALLRNKAYRTVSSAMQWTLAEMLFYLKRGDASALSLVYGNSFRMVGVPRQALHRAWPLWAERRPVDHPSLSSPLQVLAMSSLPHVKHKMWPSTHHTVIVWQACVQAAKRPGAEYKLYKELLAQVTAARGAGQAPTLESTRASGLGSTRSQDATAVARQPQVYLGGPSWMYQDAHFNVFIRSFGKTSPANAARVVSDMYRLGIQPSRESMHALLHCLVAHNKRKMVMHLLKRMEVTFAQRDERGGSKPNTTATATDEAAAHDLVLPTPNVATYLIVIKHLIYCHRSEAASHIALRMLRNLGQQAVANKAAECVLRELIRLLSDPARVHNKNGTDARLVEAIRLAKEHGSTETAADPSPRE